MANIKIQLKSEDWYWINGHGAVATFSKREWPFYPGDLNNQEVLIDNKRFRVKGVEHWAIHWRLGSSWPIGLLVEPLDDTPSTTLWRKEPERSYEKLVAQHSQINNISQEKK